MKTYTIALSGLGCGKCIKKLSDLFGQEADSQIESITKEQLVLSTSLPLSDVIQKIEQLGYGAGNHYTLALSGLNCGRCVNKVKQHLSGLYQVAEFEVSKTELSLKTTLDIDEVIAEIQSLGYQAATEKQLLNTPDSGQSTPSSSEPVENSQVHNSSEHSNVINLVLKGMTCASCVASVEKACLAVEGVSKAQINLAEQSATVWLAENADDSAVLTQLIHSIGQAGYGASAIQNQQQQQQELQQANINQQNHYKRSAIQALVIGAPMMLWGMLGGSMMITSPADQAGWGAVALICFALLATAGRSFFVNALQSLKHKRATMDTLVALGTGAAWFYSTLVVLLPEWFPAASRHVYFEASAMIIGLISLGHYIEAKAKFKTTQSLQSLIGLQAKVATVVTAEGEKELPIEQIQTGMQIRVKPGDKVAVDGTVVKGESYIDEAMLTGEPVPKLKTIGDKVSAGTINSDGSLLIEATGVGSQTMLARIISMVRQAQSSKPPIAKLADSISAVFVPVVVAIAIVTAVIWWLLGPEPQASFMLVVSTTVLIIACPCALGLATPLSITVGVGKAAEAGILIRDAEVLQTASKIDTVVFDKTGTLTEGKPSVQQITLLSNWQEKELLELVYALESHSQHPLAAAVCEYAKQLGTTLAEADNVVTQRGKGITGKVQNREVAIGSVDFITSLCPFNETDTIASFTDKAWTPVVVSIDGVAAAVIAISDTIKTESEQAVRQLNERGIEVILLSGDNKQVAGKIAAQLGIEHVIAEVLPDQKADQIQQLQKQNKKVAMVGDGINDAPALAQADIGIAMGSGSDVAIENAQMTLLNSSPVAIINAIDLSRATLKNMKQNLFGAFIYNSLGIPVAAGVLYPFTGFLLSPVIAGAAMALSSITVVTNANRLRLFKLN